MYVIAEESDATTLSVPPPTCPGCSPRRAAMGRPTSSTPSSDRRAERAHGQVSGELSPLLRGMGGALGDARPREGRVAAGDPSLKPVVGHGGKLPVAGQSCLPGSSDRSGRSRREWRRSGSRPVKTRIITPLGRGHQRHRVPHPASSATSRRRHSRASGPRHPRCFAGAGRARAARARRRACLSESYLFCTRTAPPPPADGSGRRLASHRPAELGSLAASLGFDRAAELGTNTAG